MPETYFHSDILIARNPFGLFKDFDPTYSIFRAKLDYSAIGAEELQINEEFSTPFEELRRVDIQTEGICQMITNRLSWEGKTHGTVSYLNYRNNEESTEVKIYKPQFRSMQGNDYFLEPEDLVYFESSKPEVKFGIHGNEIVEPEARVSNMDSWAKVITHLHELGHYRELIGLNFEETTFYQDSRLHFNAYILRNNGDLSANVLEKAAKLNLAEMTEVLKHEHIAARFVLNQIGILKQHLNLPESLYLNMIKAVTQDYRTYAQWAKVLLGN